jgi:hypothetical protein
MKNLIMEASTASCYFLSLTSRRSLQHLHFHETKYPHERKLFFRLTLLQYTRSELLPTCGSLCDILINKVNTVKLSLCFNHRGTSV